MPVRDTGALTFGVSDGERVLRAARGPGISPDLQILFTPASYDRSRFGELEREPGMTAAVCAVEAGEPRHDHGGVARSEAAPGNPAELSLGAHRRCW